MRHKVRAVERRYVSGEEVYYKKDSDRTQCRGPATVIGNRGALHFLVHQGPGKGGGMQDGTHRRG